MFFPFDWRCGYVSNLWSGLPAELVTMTLRSVAPAPAVCSISSWESWRAPLRVSTRLLSFDMRFSFPSRASGRYECRYPPARLCVKALVRIAGRPRYEHRQTSGNQAARHSVQFILREWAGAHPAQNPMVAFIRHTISFPVFYECLRVWDRVARERQLFICGEVRVGRGAGAKHAQNRANAAALNTLDFILAQWAGACPAEHPVGIVRHIFFSFLLLGLLQTLGRQKSMDEFMDEKIR